MKVIIAGTRDYTDYNTVKQTCNKILSSQKQIEIISGTARGVDQLGERYAKENDYPLKRFPADWNTHGKSAGVKRNIEMAEYADALIAFWDGKSKGTSHMISEAKKRNLLLRVISVS